MHQALLVQEVVHMIMRNIRNDIGYHRKTLYNAALTCSSFLEPALVALWHDMQRLAPLFKLLSNLQPNFERKPQILWGPIRETDLTKFKKYASRVHSYHYCQDMDDVDITAYIHVLRASGSSYIFPNLVDLKILSELEVSKIMFLMTPCLRNFSMHSSLESPVVNVLNSLGVTASNISHLTLFNLPPQVNLASFSVLRYWFSRLEELRVEHKGNGNIPTFDLGLFPCLSCKENLRHFSLDGLLIVWSPHNSIFNPGIVKFPLLESINFGQCFLTSIGPITQLFRSVIVPSLKALPIRLSPFSGVLDKSVEVGYWHQFFDLVGKATTNHLKILEITMNGSYPVRQIRESWEQVGLTLSRFPNFDNLTLETFSILPPFLSSLGQNDLEKLINSWPNLTKLQLSSCRHSELDPTALVDIAVALPHLEILAIPLGIRGPLNLEGIPLLVHNLQKIDLNTLIPLTNTKILVQCIDRIFPYLKSCVFYHGDQVVWQDLLPSLLMLQNARRDEAGRATLGIIGV